MIEYTFLLVLLLLILIIFNIKNQQKMANKFDEIMAKLDNLSAAVGADEAAESELLAQKEAEIAALKAQIEETKANAGLSSAEEDAILAELNAKVADIEAQITPSAPPPAEPTA